MKLLKFFIMFLAPLSLLSAKEQGKPDLAKLKHPVKPMLWKIEGKGLEKPSYLFGTIHLADPRLTTLHPLAQQAFDASKALYTEVDLSPMNQMKLLPFMMRKDNKTLEELLGKELLNAYEAELKAINPALDSKPFEKMNVWALAFIPLQLQAQLEGKEPLDVQLWKRGQKAGKKLMALEENEQQLGQMNKLTLDEQKEMLKVTVQVYQKAREAKVVPYKSLVDAYLLGDKKGIEREMGRTSYMGLEIRPELLKKFNRLLLDERNVVMAKTIQEALSKPDAGPCFFAAGTAHYIGKNSVNDLLVKAGYRVTPVVP